MSPWGSSSAKFLNFLKEIDAQVLEKLDVHIVMDNYPTHTTSKIGRFSRSATSNAPEDSTSSAKSNAWDETVATDFVRHRSGQPRLFPTSRARHRGDEPRDDGLDKVRRPTRR
jgi:hypothetical protein